MVQFQILKLSEGLLSLLTVNENGERLGEKIETDPGDIQYKEILEARKRYLDEQFIQDVEDELEKATPDDTGNTGHFFFAFLDSVNYSFYMY